MGTNQSARLPHSVQKSQNGNIYRFEVREGETKDSDDGSLNNRAELSSQTKYPFGTELWISYSIMVHPTAAKVNSSWLLLGQMHVGNGSPPFFFDTSYNNLKIETITGTLYPKNTVGTEHTSLPLETGKWHNVVVKAKFGLNNSGALTVWINKQKVLDKPQISIGYTDDDIGLTYFKFGIYRKADPTTMVVEYANMELGKASLLDRVANPKPIIP